MKEARARNPSGAPVARGRRAIAHIGTRWAPLAFLTCMISLEGRVMTNAIGKRLTAPIMAIGALALLVVPANAQLVDPRASGAEQLRQLLRSHLFSGEPVSSAARSATGDPHITVIDRRTGGVSRCSYLYRRGERVLYCNS